MPHILKGLEAHFLHHYLGAKMAIVMRDTQLGSPASLTMSICQTCVVRPRCTGRAVPVTQPLLTPRKWLALMSRPTAMYPAGQAKLAPIEPSVSASTTLTPPCSKPNGWRVRADEVVADGNKFDAQMADGRIQTAAGEDVQGEGLLPDAHGCVFVGQKERSHHYSADEWCLGGAG